MSNFSKMMLVFFSSHVRLRHMHKKTL